MWRDTEVSRRLKLTAPIIQGPFGNGASSIELTSLVSENGGLGSFGMNHLNGDQILETAKQIRQRTLRPFACNLWVPFQNSNHMRISDSDFEKHCQLLKPYFDELGVALPTKPLQFAPDYDEQVEAVLTVRPTVFSFVFGIPDADVLARCKKLEIVTIGTATSVDEAKTLEQAGVDMIVATGFEAGGHRVSFLKPAEESLMGTFALVPQVVDAVKIPVIAAGGIAEARGVAAALRLGASGVQIGTAFLACEESGALPVHRKALWSEQAKTTDLTRVFSGRLARGIKNRLMDELKKQPADLLPYPIQNWFMSKLRSAANEQGRADLMSLWCGQTAPLLHHHHATALLKALIQDTNRILKK